MTVLGKRKEYQEIISNEIADVSRIKITEKYISSFYLQKIREMEQIDRQRSKALEKRLNKLC